MALRELRNSRVRMETLQDNELPWHVTTSTIFFKQGQRQESSERPNSGYHTTTDITTVGYTTEERYRSWHDAQ